MPAYQVKNVDVFEFYTIMSKYAGVVQTAKFRPRHNPSSYRHMVFVMKPIPFHRAVEDIRHEIITVWDVNRSQYRRIDLRSVDYITIDQTEYHLKHKKQPTTP